MNRLMRWLWVSFFLAVLLTCWGGVALAQGDSIVRVVYFVSSECDRCQAVADEVLGPLQRKHGDRLQIKAIDISDPNALGGINAAKYEMLLYAEKVFDASSEERELPLLVIGGEMLVGEDAIRERLPCLLESCLGREGTSWPDIPGLESVAAEGTGGPGVGLGGSWQEDIAACEADDEAACDAPVSIWVAYFYEADCQECSLVQYNIRYVESKYPQLVVEEYDMQEDAGLAEWLGERFEVPQGQRMKAPALFVGEDYLIGADVTAEAVLALAEKYASTGTERVWNAAPAYADDERPVVRAILFYSPSCPACHMVINETLPPLQNQYGEQLEVHLADTSTPEGHALYEAAAEGFQFEQLVVPIMIVGDMVLVGGREIPQSLPGLIENGLASGGVEWPALPGFELSNESSSDRSAIEIIRSDMPGNAISIAVLCGMVLSLGYVLRDGVRVWQAQKARRQRHKRKHRRPTRLPDWWDWAVAGLCVFGLIVAGYLAYVETAEVEAVCGPVGDCNAVQHSAYALLFGLIPIAVFGLAGYVVILAVWAFGRFGRGRPAELAPVALLGLALFGTGFSTYLTFLEPFVIGATCSWCLASAVSMTLLLLLVARPGWEALAREWRTHIRVRGASGKARV